MIKIGIVEDNHQDSERLTALINGYFPSKGIDFTIDTFDHADSFLNEERNFDLIFLDIFLGGTLTGMDIAKKIRERFGEKPVIVFVTSSMSYVLEGYSVGASAYILKPLSEEDFALKMPRVTNILKRRATDYLLLHVGDEAVSVNISDILYVEVYGHYLTYHVKDEKYTVRQTLASAEEKLSDYGFFRINKYNLVNLKAINKISGDDIHIKDDVLKISRSRKREFKKMVVEKYA